MALTIETAKDGDYYRVTAKGDIDLYSSPELRAAILKAVKRKEGVAVDLSGVGYMDSSGVATLVEGLKSCAVDHQEFIIEKPSDAVMKVLQLARLDTLFKISRGPGGQT